MCLVAILQNTTYRSLKEHASCTSEFLSKVQQLTVLTYGMNLTSLKVKVKVTVKLTLEQVKKAQWGSRGLALFL
jgi:hypothetical protein